MSIQISYHPILGMQISYLPQSFIELKDWQGKKFKNYSRRKLFLKKTRNHSLRKK